MALIDWHVPPSTIGRYGPFASAVENRLLAMWSTHAIQNR